MCESRDVLKLSSQQCLNILPTFVGQPLGSPVHVLDDTRIVLANHGDPRKLYLVEGGNQSELAIPDEMKTFERFSFNASSNVLVFTDNRKSDKVNVVGKDHFTDGQATIYRDCEDWSGLWIQGDSVSLSLIDSPSS